MSLPAAQTEGKQYRSIGIQLYNVTMYTKHLDFNPTKHYRHTSRPPATTHPYLLYH